MLYSLICNIKILLQAFTFKFFNTIQKLQIKNQDSTLNSNFYCETKGKNSSGKAGRLKSFDLFLRPKLQLIFELLIWQ